MVCASFKRRLSSSEGFQLIQVASRPRSQQDEHLYREAHDELQENGYCEPDIVALAR
jgi:hypothetical protein